MCIGLNETKLNIVENFACIFLGWHTTDEYLLLLEIYRVKRIDVIVFAIQTEI